MLSDYQQGPRTLVDMLLESRTVTTSSGTIDNNGDNIASMPLEESSPSTTSNEQPSLASILKEVLEFLDDCDEDYDSDNDNLPEQHQTRERRSTSTTGPVSNDEDSSQNRSES